MENQQQFILLIQQHEGILYKISKLYMDKDEDKEDLLQEMILQLWRSYPCFSGKSEFSTWMYRVCLNTALTHYKREKRQSSTHEFLRISFHNESIPCEEDDEQISLFYKAVRELSKVEKALIFLFLEGQSHKQIAQNLGITEGNARVKLNRTKNKIQSIIKGYGYEF